MKEKNQYKQRNKKRTFVEKGDIDKQEMSFTDCRGTWKKNQIDWIVDFVTFTEEILNGKLYFLCSVTSIAVVHVFRFNSKHISAAGTR